MRITRLVAHCRAALAVAATAGGVLFIVSSSRAAEDPSRPEIAAGRATNTSSAGADEDCAPNEPGCANEEDSGDPTRLLIGAEADLVSRYLWRGLALSDGPVLQPSLWASLRNFTIGASANLNLQREKWLQGVDFFMPEVSYRWSMQQFVVEPGVIGYVDQPGSSSAGAAPSSTAEGSLKLSYDLGPLLLSSTHYVDIAQNPGAYFGNAVMQAVKGVPQGMLRAYVELGWASAAFNGEHNDVDAGGFRLVGGGVEVRADITDSVYVTLHSAGSALVTGALRRSTREPELYNVGVAFGGEVSE